MNIKSAIVNNNDYYPGTKKLLLTDVVRVI